MSKELAQTVGGKKIAWLLAILAALAVFATVANTWQSAKANVAGTDFVVTNDNPGGGNIIVGQSVTYTVTYTVTGSAHVAPSTIVAGTLDADLDITGIGPNTGPAPVCSGTGTNAFSCTFTPALALGATGTLTITAQLQNTATDGAALTAATATVDDGSAEAAVPATITTTALTQQNTAISVTKTDSPDPVALGGNVTYVITVANAANAETATSVTLSDVLPAEFSAIQSVSPSAGTCSAPASFPSTTMPLTVTCALGSLAAGASETVTVVATISAATASTTTTNTATVNHQVNSVAGAVAAGSAATTITQPAPANTDVADGLYHLDPWGDPITDRDDPNNLIGYTHEVCLDDDDGTDYQGNPINITSGGDIDGIEGNVLTSSGIRWRIQTISGSADLNGQQMFVRDFDGDSIIEECVRWYSNHTGEQNVTIIDEEGEVIADWADGGTGVNADVTDDCFGSSNGPDGDNDCNPIGSYTPLVKEWNVLEPTDIRNDGSSTSVEGTIITKSVLFDASDSLYKYIGAGGLPQYVKLDEHVFGSHTGWSGLVDGAEVTFTVSGTCGFAVIDPSTATGFPTTVEGINLQLNALPAGGTKTVTSAGVPINFWIGTVDCATLNDAYTTVTINVDYPTTIGSFPPDELEETVTVKWVSTIPTKQRFLAWAGQRVILEHDWRVPDGDTDGGASTSPAPSGACAFGDNRESSFIVKYVRQGLSDGNFVEGLGALTSGNDQALVNVAPDDEQLDSETTLSGQPQGHCISRVLYESENPGQVNVEAMVVGTWGISEIGNPFTDYTPLVDNQTKIAFVIYYMKLESVTVSLVNTVAKPYHNVSNTDWSPGNPWDATKDVSTVDWNVSRDLLVRARVKGWFTSANATGRAAGTDSNGGLLPAGRWVMPDDWPLLAGGPADPADGSDAKGVAELYSPDFDIMIAPNNASGYALDIPEGFSGTGASYIPVSALAAAMDQVTTKIVVPYAYPLSACPTGIIRIDNEDISVAGLVGVANGTFTTWTYTGALRAQATGSAASAHDAGASITCRIPTAMPFEGPYSLLDTRSLTGPSAALSNWDSNNVRKTMWPDGDVDMWDAPMPPAMLNVSVRGAGFIKQVLKQDVYYKGTANSTTGQTYPNPFYIVNIPDSPFIAANVEGGGYLWNSWGPDGPGCVKTASAPDCNDAAGLGQGVYRFWRPAKIGSNSLGVVDSSVTATQAAELAAIRTAYGDPTIARDLVVYTDNHGEAMVAANGDFKLDYSGCASNALAGGKHCAPGDKAGASTITAVAEYPDFRGKHYPLMSNVATVNWTWGGYKDVTIEDGETEQYKYVVFHALDRDGFCSQWVYYADAGYDVPELLHPVLTSATNDTFNGNPSETVDFMIDSGEGIILTTSDGSVPTMSYTKQFAEGITTFSTAENEPAVSGVKEFPLSPLAATGATDECQAWVKVSNSLLGILDILVIAHDDEGNIGFDKIIDLQSTMSYSLSFRWTLFTWAGADGLATADALKGSGGSTNDITSSVTAVYGWDPAAQAWLGYFPSAVPVPGANDLTKLNEGDAYWIAITGPGSVTWTIATNVD